MSEAYEMAADHEKLESSIPQSGGEAVEIIVEGLRQEKKTLMGDFGQEG